MFDRSAITEGRNIQDFGLCDLSGVYQTTTKLRGKGWLIVSFFTPDDRNSIAVLDKLTEWAASLPGDKVSILGVLDGDHAAVQGFKNRPAPPFPIVCDFESYWTVNWGLESLPTTFITDAGGRVLDRIVGSDMPALEEAKSQLESLIARAAEAAKAAAAAAAAAPTPAVAAPPAAAPTVTPPPAAPPAAAATAKAPAKPATKAKSKK